MIERNRRILQRNTCLLRWDWAIMAVNAGLIFPEIFSHREWLLCMTVTVMALLAAGMIFLAHANRRLQRITAQLEYRMAQQHF